jgi:hypothetical protein
VVSPHSTITRDQYIARLQSEFAAIQIEPGCNILGPVLECTVLPDLPPWWFELFILFDDGMYIRVWEHFNNVAGSRRHGQRAYFSFHYGLTPAGRDINGRPIWNNSDSVELRIDLDSWNADHLHYRGENHIPQSRVKNMVISEMDIGRFLKGIMESRGSKRPIHEIFGFEIT